MQSISSSYNLARNSSRFVGEFFSLISIYLWFSLRRSERPHRPTWWRRKICRRIWEIEEETRDGERRTSNEHGGIAISFELFSFVHCVHSVGNLGNVRFYSHVVMVYHRDHDQDHLLTTLAELLLLLRNWKAPSSKRKLKCSRFNWKWLNWSKNTNDDWQRRTKTRKAWGNYQLCLFITKHTPGGWKMTTDLTQSLNAQLKLLLC